MAIIYSKTLKNMDWNGDVMHGWLVFQPEVVLMSPPTKQGKTIKKTGSDRHGERWRVVHAWQKAVDKRLSTDHKPIGRALWQLS